MGERLKYYLYLCLFMPLAWLPLCILYRLSDLLYVIMYRMKHYRLHVVRENLRTSFPDKSQQELLQIEKEFYHHFCDNIVETIKLLHISDKQMRRRVTVHGTEFVEDTARRNRPLVIYLGHYGNWEWVPSITLFYNEPKVSAQIYKPIHDAAFDKLMLRLRSRFHSISIPRKKAFRQLLTMRRDIGTFMVGFISDHRTNRDASKYHIDFLRHDTEFFPGGEEIGNRIDAEFLYLDVEKTGRGHYTFTLVPIVPDDTDQDYPITRKYLKMLEATIDRAPAYWLWSHKRWLKPKK